MNLKRVYLSIQKVFESNLGQFLQTEKINGGKTRSGYFNYEYIQRVGVEVVNQTLEIGETKNKWLSMQLDLKKLIKPGEKGLFLVRLYFNQEDMLVKLDHNNTNEYDGDEEGDYYYQNQWYRHNSIYKPVVMSDVALTVKQSQYGSQYHVFATHIVDATPLAGVKITLRTFQNQIITSGVTDNEGKALIKEVNQEVFYIEGEKDGQRSFVLPGEMTWNISSYDTGGQEDTSNKTSAYIYTERGVYRPGDEIHLALIARNPDHTFPANFPVTLNLYNPKDQVVFNKTQNTSADGFYHFSFRTKPEDLTGNWRAECHVGPQTFSHTLKIETVAPYRLKVNLTPAKKQYTADDPTLDLALQANYLFGNPAAHLKANVGITLMQGSTTFSRYPGFIFDNESILFQNIQGTLYDNPLDEKGHTDMQWDIPDLSQAPGPLTAQIIGKVFEQGGGASRNDIFVPIYPFAQYIGLQKPTDWTQAGIDIVIPTVLVNQNGETLAGRRLKYTVYKNDRYWWWEYENVRDFRVRFRKDTCTRIIQEGHFTTQKTAVNIVFNPSECGEFFIEVEEADRTGHRSGFFFSSWNYGDYGKGAENANIGTLALGTDKKVYRPGETATIYFPNPGNGLAIVTLEKNSRILNSWLYKTGNLETIKTGNHQEAAKLSIKIPVTDAMVPNAYISVSVIQAHAQTINDRPLRMFGIVPIMVVDPDTQQQLNITMANGLRSNEPFDVSISTSDGKPTQFTIAVVDEGLLDITRFVTPNPWEHFFQKERLSINTFDLFSFVIGANKGDIFRLFSIGGDRANGDSYRGSQLETEKNKRFKPVSLFKGPLTTDANGKAKVSFTMPDYIGSVRVMVVSASKDCYGRAEKTVPVKTPLMVLPKLPRTLTPGDKLAVPVSVFALENTLKSAKVSIQVTGPLDIIGESSMNVTFDKPGEKDVWFNLSVRQEIGEAVVTVIASAPQMTVKKETHLTVHANSPRIYGSQMYTCETGAKVQIPIPEIGMPGSNKVTLSILRRQELKLNHRLDWLIHYPYGCIEQTTSTAFPQLYVKSFLKKSNAQEKEIDHNINGGIQRLRTFLTPAGSFGYWPGASEAHIWGTNYGFHFLVEAKKLGYFVPADLLTALVKFQKARALTESDTLLERTYRLYLLALAGEPQIGPMNLLKENSLDKMTNTEKYLLSAAYFISGRQGVSKSILANATTDVCQYAQGDTSFGSQMRDQAIMLEISVLRSDWNTAGRLYDLIVKQLATESWYSTQSLGYSLLAVGKFISLFEDTKKNPFMSGVIELPGVNAASFKTEGLKYTLNIEKGFGKNAEVSVDKNSPRVFILVEYNGLPMNYEASDVNKNLTLEVRWLDELGAVMDPASIQQGTTFWGHFRVRLTNNYYSHMNEMALVQVLPSGWEIENTRLLKEEKPQFMKDWILDREEYLDIRDDRVMWFFDMEHGTIYDFVVKLNAVTIGHFTLPPTLFEAMYDANYQNIKTHGRVEVKK